MAKLLVAILGVLYVGLGTFAGILRFFMIPGPDYFLLLPGSLIALQALLLYLREPERLLHKLLLQFVLSLSITALYLFVIWRV